MSESFTLKSLPNHVEVDYSPAVGVELAAIKKRAEKAGGPKSHAFEPEVAFFEKLIGSLRAELPTAMRNAGWPDIHRTGDKLDEFILMTIKDLARNARGRGTNASAKQAVIRIGAL